jgi:hypothetical protein
VYLNRRRTGGRIRISPTEYCSVRAVRKPDVQPRPGAVRRCVRATRSLLRGSRLTCSQRCESFGLRRLSDQSVANRVSTHNGRRKKNASPLLCIGPGWRGEDGGPGPRIERGDARCYCDALCSAGLVQSCSGTSHTPGIAVCGGVRSRQCHRSVNVLVIPQYVVPPQVVRNRFDEFG